jgi:hypothetical protein
MTADAGAAAIGRILVGEDRCAGDRHGSESERGENSCQCERDCVRRCVAEWSADEEQDRSEQQQGSTTTAAPGDPVAHPAECRCGHESEGGADGDDRRQNRGRVLRVECIGLEREGEDCGHELGHASRNGSHAEEEEEPASWILPFAVDRGGGRPLKGGLVGCSGCSVRSGCLVGGGWLR